jgi:SEC-C motif-containing protein
MSAAPGSALKAVDTSTPCPCGDPRGYAACCGPLHQGQPAPDAQALMRSRYSAYVLRDEAYLLATWHPDTRPASLRLAVQQPAPSWLGLSVKAVQLRDADHATVEFVARFRIGGGRAQRLHERSRFVREDGRWYYVDGDILGG